MNSKLQENLKIYIRMNSKLQEFEDVHSNEFEATRELRDVGEFRDISELE